LPPRLPGPSPPDRLPAIPAGPRSEFRQHHPSASRPAAGRLPPGPSVAAVHGWTLTPAHSGLPPLFPAEADETPLTCFRLLCVPAHPRCPPDTHPSAARAGFPYCHFPVTHVTAVQFVPERGTTLRLL